jgi:hypothetical protein
MVQFQGQLLRHFLLLQHAKDLPYLGSTGCSLACKPSIARNEAACWQMTSQQ